MKKKILKKIGDAYFNEKLKEKITKTIEGRSILVLYNIDCTIVNHNGLENVMVKVKDPLFNGLSLQRIIMQWNIKDSLENFLKYEEELKPLIVLSLSTLIATMNEYKFKENKGDIYE